MHGLASTLFLEDLNTQMMVGILIVNWILGSTFLRVRTCAFTVDGMFLDRDVSE